MRGVLPRLPVLRREGFLTAFDQLVADLEEELRRCERLARSSHLPMEQLPTLADYIQRVEHAIETIRLIPQVFPGSTVEMVGALRDCLVVGAHTIGFSDETEGWSCIHCGRWRSAEKLFENLECGP